MKSRKSVILNKVKFLLLSFAFIILFFSCATNKSISDKTETESINSSSEIDQKDSLSENQQKEERQTSWEKKVESIDEISGLWRAYGGSEYEWPFVLNGKKYLRIAYTEKDVTEDFANYAKNHNMDFNKLWSHRYAYLGNIYGVKLQDGRLVPSPYSHENGIQQGIKLRADYTRSYSRNIGFRIFARNEILVPETIARNNASSFTLKYNLGEYSIVRRNRFNGGTLVLDGDFTVYKKTEDYWTK